MLVEASKKDTESAKGQYLLLPSLKFSHHHRLFRTKLIIIRRSFVDNCLRIPLAERVFYRCFEGRLSCCTALLAAVSFSTAITDHNKFMRRVASSTVAYRRTNATTTNNNSTRNIKIDSLSPFGNKFPTPIPSGEARIDVVKIKK